LPAPPIFSSDIIFHRQTLQSPSAPTDQRGASFPASETLLLSLQQLMSDSSHGDTPMDNTKGAAEELKVHVDDGLSAVPKTGLRLPVGSDTIDVRDAGQPLEASGHAPG
jgi:hypothetical protein